MGFFVISHLRAFVMEDLFRLIHFNVTNVKEVSNALE
jgi:hypothetical protein